MTAIDQIEALIVEAERIITPTVLGTFDGVRLDGRLNALRECLAIVKAETGQTSQSGLNRTVSPSIQSCCTPRQSIGSAGLNTDTRKYSSSRGDTFTTVTCPTNGGR